MSEAVIDGRLASMFDAFLEAVEPLNVLQPVRARANKQAERMNDSFFMVMIG